MKVHKKGSAGKHINAEPLKEFQYDYNSLKTGCKDQI